MRWFRLDLAPWPERSLRLLPVMLLCVAFLAGCRFGEQGNLFDQDGAIERAIGTLKYKLGTPLSVMSLVIEPNRILIRTQDPTDHNRIDEWQLDHTNMLLFNWDSLSGPRLYFVNGPSSIPGYITNSGPVSSPAMDIEGRLFGLDEIDFTASAALARAAVERAQLAESARVTKITIARRHIFERSSPTAGVTWLTSATGEIRWTVNVASSRESAMIIADAQGTIVGAFLDETERAKKLDILHQLSLAEDAASSFRFVLGSDASLTSMRLVPRYVIFETNVSDSSPPVPVSDSQQARRAYVWSLNGLQRTFSTTRTKPAPSGGPPQTFTIDDIDWAKLPAIIAAAPAQLSMPQRQVTGIELSRSDNPLGPAILLWKIEVMSQSEEPGFVLADATGNVKQLVLPQSQRKPVDYYDPATIVDVFSRLGSDFGQDREYAEITIFNDKVAIIAQNHMEPNAYSQIVLSDAGLERAAIASRPAYTAPPFRIGDLSALTVQRLADLEARTLETLKMPPKSISSIAIGRGNTDPSARGLPTIEIKAEDKSTSRSGRIIYELDGTVIRAYLPQ